MCDFMLIFTIFALFAGWSGYLVLGVLEPLLEEVLHDTPLAVLTLVMSPLHTFWKIPGCRSKGLAIVDAVSTTCCYACASSKSWGQAAVTWLGPICGVAFVTSCNTVMHVCKFLKRRAMSAADIVVQDSSIHTHARQHWWGSVSPSWHRLKGTFLSNRQDICHKASVQKEDQQPGTDAAAHTPFKIKLQPARVLRFMGAKEDEPAAVVHLAGDPTAMGAAHLAVAKQGSAALQGDDVQSDLLKAHRARSADPVSHRAAGDGPAAEPDQTAHSDVKLNKRARREAKKAAKAAAAVDEGEADIAPVMLAANEEDDAVVEAEPVKAVSPASPAHGRPVVPTSLTAQGAAATEEAAWERVHHKQDRRSQKRVAGVLMGFLSRVITHVPAAYSFMNECRAACCSKHVDCM